MTSRTVQQFVIQERLSLINDLATLRPDQWGLPTECGFWSVHDVVAHLVDTAKCTRASFVRDLVTARFDFDRANARGVARERYATPERTLEELRTVARRTSGPPAPQATRLVEILVHGEDIRRATGLTRGYPTSEVSQALTYQAGASPAVGGGREMAAGLRLVATDADVSLGEGPEVRGTALTLLRALTGRPVHADELTGPGAPRLRRAGVLPWTSADLWRAAHAERVSLATDLAGLDDDSWHQPSLCGTWSVREVVAHLTAAAAIGRLAWLRSVVGSRFDFDVHNDRRLAEHIGSTPADTLARFERVVASTTAASGHTAAWLGEVVVHGQDIRRPLGLTSAPDGEALTQVARFYASRDFAVPSHSTIKDLRLAATDGPFAVGDGPLVTGPTLALVMVMAGRAAFLDDLEGPGTTTLEQRLT